MDAHEFKNFSSPNGAELSKSIPEQIPYVRPLAKGMGEAVARRTVYRALDEDNWENVAKRVALGNTSLVEDGKADYESLRDYIASGTILLSGRHLQHGDKDQSSRNLEVYSNCSTSATSFLLFYLLLNGSGVGRDYSDAMMNINWDNAPSLLQVCASTHPNFDETVFVDVSLAKEQVAAQKHVWFTIPDSREGWAQAAELFETLAFEKATDTLLVLDWSEVRESGKPIGGMQDRPASGPVPSAYAFKSISELKGKGYPLWQQAMFVDHYLAECVVVGGARRSARMSTKYWKDKDILDYISIKKHHVLWSSNNSIIADGEFYEQVHVEGSYAQKVMKALTEAAYFDGTGEPGIINVHNFSPDNIDWSLYEDGKFADSFKYHISDKTVSYMKALVNSAKSMPYRHLTNPCVTADTWIQTENGPMQVFELIDKPFTALVGNRKYPASGFFQTGVKQVYKIKTAKGFSVRLTDNHKVLVERSRKPKFGSSGNGWNIVTEWVEVKDLKPGDKFVLDNHRGTQWSGEGTFEEGWILGQIVGDGGYNEEAKYPAYVRFWGESQKLMKETALAYASATGIKHRSDAVGSTNSKNKTSQVSMKGFDHLAAKYLTRTGKNFLPSLEKTSYGFYRGFLRGLFDADGTIIVNAEKGRSIRLTQNCANKLKVVQRMLARLGIVSTLHLNRKEAGMTMLPDGKGSSRKYFTKASHELIVSRDNMLVFSELIGFNEPAKIEKLEACVSSLGIKKKPYAETFTSEVVSIEEDGIEAVYDCTVDEIHAFDANGLVVHNCGEISLNILGGYCVIADVVPFFAKDTNDAEQAFRAATRALIRTNTMRSLYDREVKRTNRIGVGFTGLHEFAFKQFGYGFRDLLDEEKSKDFWLTMARFSRAVKQEAQQYAFQLGVNVPVTDTTVKPAGTTSKLFGVTEGAHLPSMREYLRWVQYRTDSQADEIAALREAGYPVRELTSYKNTTIVGFPTQPVICRLGMGEKLVTASEATPEEQYQYLMLLEKYWIRGTDEQGVLLEKNTGNQISYTLKYDPKKVDYNHFVEMIVRYQSKVRCCSVMPFVDTTAYEYQPEEPFGTVSRFFQVISQIKDSSNLEDIDMEHLRCSSGSCPL